MKRQGVPFGSRILPAESAASRFLPAAAAQFQKNGSSEPLFRDAAIAAMGLSTGAPQRSRGKAQGFGRPPGSRRLKTVCAFRYAAAPGAQGQLPGPLPGSSEFPERGGIRLSAAPSPQQCCDGRKVQVLESPGEGVSQHPGELPDLAVNVPGRHRHAPLLLS